MLGVCVLTSLAISTTRYWSQLAKRTRRPWRYMDLGLERGVLRLEILDSTNFMKAGVSLKGPLFKGSAAGCSDLRLSGDLPDLPQSLL